MARAIHFTTILLSVGLAFGLAAAQAQQPPAATVRGQVAAFDGSNLTVTTKDGKSAQVKIEGQPAFVGLSKIALSDIQPDAFVGAAAVPQSDGNLHAVSVHVFPENLRGANEGSRDYDVAPRSSMTNGSVAQKVISKDGQVLTIKFKSEQKSVLVDDKTSLVRFEPGAAATEIQPGVFVVVNGIRNEDGSVTARRILIGRNGVVPAL